MLDQNGSDRWQLLNQKSVEKQCSVLKCLIWLGLLSSQALYAQVLHFDFGAPASTNGAIQIQDALLIPLACGKSKSKKQCSVRIAFLFFQ